MNDCDLCQRHPTGRCAWHTPEAIAFTENYWREHDPADTPEDYNGLQISAARYAGYMRERRMQCHSTTS